MRPGELIDGRFDLESRAAAGGMGAVYRARDRQTGLPVALKVLHPEVERDDQRFLREAEVLASFEHPGIVRYVAHGVSDGRPYLVMEWIDGSTLKSVLEGAGLSMVESIAVLSSIADALAYAHRRGVVHRDVKPSNIIFEDGALDAARLIDFGIALDLDSPTRFTVTGTILGTPSYMAPEQALAQKQLDARTDVFALGCILYECLTGRTLLAGQNPLAIQAKALLLRAPRLRELVPSAPAELDELLAAMLAVDAGARPADAADLNERLALLGPMPSTERVGRFVEETATVVGKTPDTAPPADMTCLILAARTADATTRQELSELDTLVAPFAGTCQRLRGGVSMIVIEGTGSALEQARLAGRCALAIRNADPDMALALSIGETGRLDEAIERGAHSIEVAARRAFVGGVEPTEAGAIRLDSLAAGLLSGAFHITSAGSKTYYLHGKEDHE